MGEFVRICGRGELPPNGEAREFPAGPRMVCVANVGGEICALDNVCPHRGGPLGQGIIENGKIVCPWHAFAFDVKTGELDHDPREKIAVYEVKIQGDDVLVNL